MIKLENFFNFLKKREISFFTGVPDSILKEFSIYIEHKKIKHIPATNEGSAVALATGYYLSNKKIPAIYLQNSGLGNAINPLISILHKKVYSIPSLLIIGWRGAPGLKDEPQHLTKGKITKNLLKLAGIKYCIINDEKSFKELSNLLSYSKKNNVPVACLIKKNTFTKNKKYFVEKNENFRDLKRDHIIKELLKKVRNTKIISSTGYISRELFRLSSNKQKKNNFYVVGGMGHCSMIALGYSLFSKKQVLCLDGDGSMLMHLGSIFTIGQQSKKNFKYILLNNDSHESVGGQKTNLSKINLERIIKEFKFEKYYLIKNKKDLNYKLNLFLASKKRSFLEIKMSSFNNNSLLGRPKDFIEIKKNFMK
jgi:phosphonopyruvate decarboxylase